MAKAFDDAKTHFYVVLIPSIEGQVGYAPQVYRDSISGAVDRPPRTLPVLRLLI